MYGGKFMRLQHLVDNTINQLSVLYSVSNLQGTIMTKDGKIDNNTNVRFWLCDEAKYSYGILQKRLLVLLKEQEEALNEEKEKKDETPSG
jgi:hypothetical protein